MQDSFTEEEIFNEEESEVYVSNSTPKTPFVAGQHTLDCCGLVHYPLPERGPYDFHGFSHTSIPGEYTFGRDKGLDCWLPYPEVEPMHAKLKLQYGIVYLKNLTAQPNVRLDNVSVEGKVILPVGVPFSIADQSFCVECSDPTHSPTKTKPDGEAKIWPHRMDETDDVVRKRVPSGFFLGRLFVIRGTTCFWLLRSQLKDVFRIEKSITFIRNLSLKLPSYRNCTAAELKLITRQEFFKNGKHYSMISLPDCIQLLERTKTIVPFHIKILASQKFDTTLELGARSDGVVEAIDGIVESQDFQAKKHALTATNDNPAKRQKVTIESDPNDNLEFNCTPPANQQIVHKLEQGVCWLYLPNRIDFPNYKKAQNLIKKIHKQMCHFDPTMRIKYSGEKNNCVYVRSIGQSGKFYFKWRITEGLTGVLTLCDNFLEIPPVIILQE